MFCNCGGFLTGVIVLRLLEMKSRFESDIDRGTAGAGTRFPQDRPIEKT